MPEYNTEKVKITDEAMHGWKKGKIDAIAQKTGIFTLDDETVRENIARAFMMVCGSTLEDTFDPGKINTSPSFGKKFAALLEKAAGVIEFNPNDDIRKSELITHISNDFFRKNPDAREDVIERAEFPETNADDYEEKKIAEWRRDEKWWAEDILAEMYYAAMKNVMETPYPDIDYSNEEEIRAFADSYQVILDMGKAFAENKETEKKVGKKTYENITVEIAENHEDFNALMEQLQINNMIREAVLDASVDPGKPFHKEKLEQALNGKMVLELYGKDLAGMSGSKAAEKHSLKELEEIKKLAKKLATEEYKPEQYQQIKDYLDGKPEGISPFYLKDGKVERNAAFDRQTPSFNLSKVPDTLSKASMFDQVFSKFKDHPSIQEDSAVKRIYIDGKNAYDMFKDKYYGTEQEIETQVKKEIVQAVMDAKKRVEFARINVTNDGQPKVTVVPVTADLSGFDEGKKWYEASVAKKAENLWKNDREQEKRRAEISKEVEDRQRTKMALAGYNNSFYNDILKKMNNIRREYINPEFLAAEQKLKDNPEIGQKWQYAGLPAKVFSEIVRNASDLGKDFHEIVNDERLNVLFPKDTPARDVLDEIIHAREKAEQIIAREERRAAKKLQVLEDSELQDMGIEQEKAEREEVRKHNIDRPQYNKGIKKLKQEIEERHNKNIEEGKNALETRNDEIVEDCREEMKDEIENILRRYRIERNPDQRTLSFPERFSMGINVEHHMMDAADIDQCFLGEDKHAYDAYAQVHVCNVKVMEAMIADMRKISPADPEKFRSDIRSIRSLMETVGISQDDMNQYGESLDGAQKKAFEQIRRWEKTVLNGNWDTVIPSAEGSADVKASVDRMLKMYQNAYYEKLGYEERIDPAFEGHAVDRIFNIYKDEPVKKQVDFGTLLKDGKTEPKVPESRAGHMENAKKAEKVNTASDLKKK